MTNIEFPSYSSINYKKALEAAKVFNEEEAKKVVGPPAIEFVPVEGYDEARKAAIKAAEEQERLHSERSKTVGESCIDFEPSKE